MLFINKKKHLGPHWAQLAGSRRLLVGPVCPLRRLRQKSELKIKKTEQFSSHKHLREHVCYCIRNLGQRREVLITKGDALTASPSGTAQLRNSNSGPIMATLPHPATPVGYLAHRMIDDQIEMPVLPMTESIGSHGPHVHCKAIQYLPQDQPDQMPMLYDKDLINTVLGGSREEIVAVVHNSRIANAQSHTGETLVMKVCRHVMGVEGTQRVWVLAHLLEMGGDTMVCCDAGKNVLHDLFWSALPPPIEVSSPPSATLSPVLGFHRRAGPNTVGRVVLCLMSTFCIDCSGPRRKDLYSSLRSYNQPVAGLRPLRGTRLSVQGCSGVASDGRCYHNASQSDWAQGTVGTDALQG